MTSTEPLASEPSPTDTWLRRVQGLLAKAESTEFPAEAETLLAKAQELMARHAIDEAMLQAAGAVDREEVASEAVVVEPPYAGPRCSLLGRVARANGCRAVVVESAAGTKRCVLVGHRSDLARTTTLFAALSLHATRAMLAAPVPAHDTARRFRHAFLLAFSARIGERLDAAALAARTDASASGSGRAQGAGPSVSLVLRDRKAAVEGEVSRLFPNLRVIRSTASSAAGFRSGREAADRADVGSTRLARSARRGLSRPR